MLIKRSLALSRQINNPRSINLVQPARGLKLRFKDGDQKEKLEEEETQKQLPGRETFLDRFKSLCISY